MARKMGVFWENWAYMGKMECHLFPKMQKICGNILETVPKLPDISKKPKKRQKKVLKIIPNKSKIFHATHEGAHLRRCLRALFPEGVSGAGQWFREWLTDQTKAVDRREKTESQCRAYACA